MFQHAFETIQVTQWLMAVFMGVLAVFSLLHLRWLWQSVDDKKQLLIPLLILIIGIVVRLWWIDITQPQPVSDFKRHWEYASAFTHGDMQFTHPAKHPGIMLIYSFAMTFFGVSLNSIWLANMFFAILMLVFTYGLCLKIFGVKNYPVALLSMTIMALHPQLVSYTAIAATEIATLALMLLITWSMLETRDTQKSIAYWVGLGILIYGTAMVRSTTLLYLPLMMLLILLFRRDQLVFFCKRFIVMLLTTSLLMSTWLYHQYLIGGQFKLYYGSELWLAMAVQYNRGSRFTDLSTMHSYPAFRDDYNSADPKRQIHAFHLIGEEAGKIVADNPRRYLSKSFVKLKNMFKAAQSGVRWCRQGSSIIYDHVSKRFINRLCRVANLSWLILLFASLPGLFFLARRQKPNEARPEAHEAAILIGVFTGVWVVFHYLVSYANERYAVQLFPYIAILAAFAVVTAIRALWESYLSFRPAPE